MHAWPSLLDDDLVAEYCSMSKDSFLVLAHHYKLRPVELPLRLLRWRTADVQAMLDRLPLRGQPDAPSAAPLPDPAAMALKLVAGQMKR